MSTIEEKSLAKLLIKECYELYTQNPSNLLMNNSYQYNKGWEDAVQHIVLTIQNHFKE